MTRWKHDWLRDSRNPLLRPGPDGFDSVCCMNPHVVRRGDEYWLFYAGGDAAGARRICLATAKADRLDAWTKHGPVLELGGEGDFDASWCVLPCLLKIGSAWHLYYTGRNLALGPGLQSFTGIGLAVSDDLVTWTKHPGGPVLRGDGFPDFPGNRGIAGGGNILALPQPDGDILYRMHFTLLTGTPNPDVKVDQAKLSAVAESHDGIHWFNKRITLRPRPEADYENVATTGLVVWREDADWRAIYPAIGTQFGAYSLCEAVSRDGEHWERGAPGENLALPPQGDGWESAMTEYPSLIEEDGKLRLFYCGNGYGRTGIGTAVSDKSKVINPVLEP